jgi:hypothetical protein
VARPTQHHRRALGAFLRPEVVFLNDPRVVDAFVRYHPAAEFAGRRHRHACRRGSRGVSIPEADRSPP